MFANTDAFVGLPLGSTVALLLVFIYFMIRKSMKFTERKAQEAGDQEDHGGQHVVQGGTEGLYQAGHEVGSAQAVAGQSPAS